MKRMVLDLSVCSKWFFGKKKKTRDQKIAVDLFQKARKKQITLIEPAIWRPEIVAKMSQKSPIRIDSMLTRFFALDARIDNSDESLRRAAELAIELNHDLFDTLYHAVAMNHSVDLITANTAYYRKARSVGNIILLRDLPATMRIAERRAKYLARKRKRKRRPPARLRKKR
jgi:predicted nucleic acid-binding protein